MDRCLALLLLAAPLSARAVQPADCPRAMLQPPSQLPLELNLQGLPGVPAGVSGQAFVTVPMTGGTDCGAPPQKPSRDVLRGPPGNVLLGR